MNDFTDARAKHAGVAEDADLDLLAGPLRRARCQVVFSIPIIPYGIRLKLKNRYTCSI
jgi:hypothetical protein